MIIENVFRELELLLSDITFGGLRSVQPITLKRLEELKLSMKELNMTEGIKRTDKLIHDLQEYQLGNISVEILASSLCELEIYEKQILMNIR